MVKKCSVCQNYAEVLVFDKIKTVEYLGFKQTKTIKINICKDCIKKIKENK